MASFYDLETGDFLGNCVPGSTPPPGQGYAEDDFPTGMHTPRRVDGGWVAGEPVQDAPPSPIILHMADFRLSLLAAGLLEQVETFMAGPDVSPECKILWEYATQVHRNDQYLNQMASAMGFTEADLDGIFGIEATLPA